MSIPELGVGIIYSSGFEKVLESNLDLIQVIEIEPQTFWCKNTSKLDSFIFNEREIDYLKSFDQQKIFHGVGYPIAGYLPLDKTHIPYMQEMIDELNPVWLSEHLSFNNIIVNGRICNTNFLLPPLQTIEGIETAVRNIKEYSSNFDLPFSFETGVNYLSNYDFEIEDGIFINEIAKKANTNILLDIHNLLANQKNGRQPINDLINQLDHEKITQIHLAGGFYFDDYYLDAHSNVSSDEVIDIFEKVVKKLPNLKAITFEMLPEYLNFVSAKSIRSQLEKMNRVWDKRAIHSKVKIKKIKEKTQISNIKKPTVKDWESTIGGIVDNRDIDKDSFTYQKLKNDKGLVLINKLVKEFKSSLIVSSLKFTCRYLMLKRGLVEFESLLKSFWKNSNPQLFATDNGLSFAKYIIESKKISDSDQILLDLATYEYNSLKSLTDNKKRVVKISFNPEILQDFLSVGKIPENIDYGNFEITILPNTNHNSEKEPIQPVIHT